MAQLESCPAMRAIPTQGASILFRRGIDDCFGTVPALLHDCHDSLAGKRLAEKREDEIISAVLDSLRTIFGRRLDYRSLLEGFCWHDWQRDPFACGAYSYVLANGATARHSLAQPVEDTLFFGGEACATGNEAASVGGALQSGKRAARQLLEAAANPRRSRRTKR